MAFDAVLTRLLCVCFPVALLIIQTPPAVSGLPQLSRHADLPENSNDDEFRSNSMGVSKVIDLNTRTIAYKDHILKSCYIEKISTQSAWEKDRMLIIHPKLLTNEQVAVIGGKLVASFCFGWPSRIIRLPTKQEARTKRSNKQYYFVGRKTRGQTQSQYLQFSGAGGDDAPGKAEAEATRQGSKATVYGSRGMGQAQSQSDPFSCADCYGPSGSQTASMFAPGVGGRLTTDGRQFDASGQPITGGQFGRPGDLTSQGGGSPGSHTPGQTLYTPDGRILHPGAPEQSGTGTVLIPGQSPGSYQTHPGQTGGGISTGFIPGQQGGSISVPGQLTTHPGQTGSLVPGTSQGQAPGLIQTYPGHPGGGSGTGSIFTPGQYPGTIQTGQGGSLPGSSGGTGSIFAPGQQSGSSQTHPGLVPTHTGSGGSLPDAGRGSGTGLGSILAPGQQHGSSQTHPGQTINYFPGSTNGGTSPGLSVQTHPRPGTGTYFPTNQISGDGAIGPGQVSPGQTGGFLETRPGSQIYDHGGLQKPVGSPTHPGDIGFISPSGQIQQGGGASAQPGQTTYFIPGGIRPRPSDGSFGYYPSPGTPGGRVQVAGSGAQDGSFSGQVAGQYRPAGGPAGDFSGTFQGRYSPHVVGSGAGTNGRQFDQSGQQYPTGAHTLPATQQGHGTGDGGRGSWEQGSGQWPQSTTAQQIPSRYAPGTQEHTAPAQLSGGQGSGPTQTPSGGALPGQTWSTQPGQTSFQQGTGVTPGVGSGQPGYHQGNILVPGQLQSSTGQYPAGPGQQGYAPGIQQQIPGQITTSGQYPSGSVFAPGQLQTTPGTGQYPAGHSLPGNQQGTVLLPGQIQPTGAGQYPSSGAQPGYQHGPGQLQTTTGTGQYPTGSGQQGYPPATQIQPGHSQTTGGQYPSPGQVQTSGTGQPGYQPGQLQTVGQYPIDGSGQTGYQQGTGLTPGHLQGAQYPSGSTGYQQGIGLSGQSVEQQGYGQQPGLTGGQQGGTGSYPGGQQVGAGSYPGGQQTGSGTYPGGQHTGTGTYPGGQQTGAVSYPGGQQTGSGTYPGGQQTGTGTYPGGQQTGTGTYPGGQTIQGQYGPPGGVGGDGRGISGPTSQQIGQYQVPGGQISQETDDANTQAQSTIQRADNETQASASSSGRFQGGTAQSQVSGSYAGTGSFSASAGTNDGLRGAQTQVSGNAEGTLSSSQGVGGRGKSQAQVQLAADTGDTTSSAQTGGLNHGTNTQVQSGIKGGMADAQANGPGSTSSQAQIGFTPYDATTNDDSPNNPHNGGGTASASSGTHAGKSQVQINGKYAFGIRYTGQAQASSANSGYTADNINLPTMKPIDFSQNQYSQSAKQQEKVNVRQTLDPYDPSTIKIITSSTTPSPDDDDSEYDDYEDPEPPPQHNPNLIQQAKTRSLMYDALNPLEDIEDHGQELEGQLKHGDIIHSGQSIPGSPGYKIPHGFRGRVAEQQSELEPTNTDQDKRIVYAVGANANRRGNHEGYGSGYSFQPRYNPINYGFKSTNQPKNFVSVTKSETGSRNILTGKKTPSVYYTQSSTCGYFTNTCVYSNGRKICLPKPKANPDGSPIICRN